MEIIIINFYEKIPKFFEKKLNIIFLFLLIRFTVFFCLNREKISTNIKKVEKERSMNEVGKERSMNKVEKERNINNIQEVRDEEEGNNIQEARDEEEENQEDEIGISERIFIMTKKEYIDLLKKLKSHEKITLEQYTELQKKVCKSEYINLLKKREEILEEEILKIKKQEYMDLLDELTKNNKITEDKKSIYLEQILESKTEKQIIKYLKKESSISTIKFQKNSWYEYIKETYSEEEIFNIIHNYEEKFLDKESRLNIEKYYKLTFNFINNLENNKKDKNLKKKISENIHCLKEKLSFLERERNESYFIRYIKEKLIEEEKVVTAFFYINQIQSKNCNTLRLLRDEFFEDEEKKLRDKFLIINDLGDKTRIEKLTYIEELIKGKKPVVIAYEIFSFLFNCYQEETDEEIKKRYKNIYNTLSSNYKDYDNQKTNIRRFYNSKGGTIGRVRKKAIPQIV